MYTTPIEEPTPRPVTGNHWLWGLWALCLLISTGLVRCDTEELEVEIRPEPAAAQDQLTPQLALARVCASELGFDGALEECAAIYAVLVRRGREHYHSADFVYAARTYSNSVFDLERRDGRAYVAHLRPDGREPAGWPAYVSTRRGMVRHAPWTAYRARWLALYEGAGAVVRGEIPNACAGDAADHWGMRGGVDLERATRAGWIEIDCRREDGTPTRNAFWRVPERVSTGDVD